MWDIDNVTEGPDGILSGRRERIEDTAFMYRCIRRKCKSAKRVERKARKVVIYTRCYDHANKCAFQDRSIMRTPIGDMTPPECCGRPMTGREIRGTFNAGVPCNAKCTGAVGHQCECSCGGKNHGKTHG